MNVLIVSSGNEPQAPFALRFFETLRQHACTEITIDSVFMSDFLHEPTTAIFQDMGIEAVIFPPSMVHRWKSAIGSNQHALGKIGKPFFLKELLETHVFLDHYDRVCYCDPDIIFQGDIADIFRNVPADKVFFSKQYLDSAKSIGPVFKMDRAVQRGLADNSTLDAYDHEINTGFFGGAPQALISLLQDWTDFMLNSRFACLKDGNDMPAAWHDQDFFRMFLRSGGGGAQIFPLNMSICATLCSGAPVFYQVEMDRVKVSAKGGGEVPTVVHFAGESWKMYPILYTYYDHSQLYPTLHRLDPAPNYFRDKAEVLEQQLAAAKRDAAGVELVNAAYRKWALIGTGLFVMTLLTFTVLTLAQ